MKRTILTLSVAAAWLLIYSDARAQVFAQPAAAAAPAPEGPPTVPATAPTTPAPRRVGAVAPQPVPQPPQVGAQVRGFGGGGLSAGNFGYNIFGGPGAGGGGFSFDGGDADPEMAKLVESENELAQQSNHLMKDYGATEDYQKRETAKKQLREILAKQFDAQRQRRELELTRVEERLRKLREQLKKRNDARETIIDRRLESLVSDAEGLGWTPPAANNTPFGLPARVGGRAMAR